MFLSVFDLFSVGIGPSSSHTVGPMRAAAAFAERLGEAPGVSRVVVHLYGSLAATGRAHGTHRALVLGLEGCSPEGVDVDAIDARLAAVRATGALRLAGGGEIGFDENADLVLHRRERLAFHPNGMRFVALDGAGVEQQSATFYSVGGGFVVEEPAGTPPSPEEAEPAPVPYPFRTGAELLAACAALGGTPADVVLANEASRQHPAAVRRGLVRLWQVMEESIRRGVTAGGTLPGSLGVTRRAPDLYRRLLAGGDPRDPATGVVALDWLDCAALAVSEENAAGGRVVTAPTNGAAGVIPAVLHYYRHFVPGASDDGVVTFLLTAGAIGALCKVNASISGAEVGCQGEVGSACAMAAAGLCAVLGGTPEQIENAAEIGIEHHLGLTCDPIGGYVQIPCIERNAVAAVKALNAAQIALRGSGRHIVSLDAALATMRRTGADMKDKYKETSRGGLALSVPEC